MPPPRPRGFASGGGNLRPAPNTPMSERQQMALLMQMTSSAASPLNTTSAEMSPSGNAFGHCPARSRDRNERGETALHVSAIKGDQDGVKKLLESGMSPNVTDFAGWTPLHEACNHNHYNVALTLVKAGANVNAKGLDDDTPLHDAAIIGNMKLVKLLVDKGADVSIKNRKGKTPVDVAAGPVGPYLASVKAHHPRPHGKKQAEQKKHIEEIEESSNASSSKQDALTSEEKSDARKTEKSTASDKHDERSSASLISIRNRSMSPGNAAQIKRGFSDVEEGTDVEDNKRKKRKDSDTSKDNFKTNTTGRTPTRQEKNLKPNSNAKQASGIAAKNANILDRKSPCVSPKPVTKTNDSDAEVDDGKGGEGFASGGPKVPPLKIVIPQQSSSCDNEGGSRNGKNNSTRNNQALPYVVASSNEANPEKESASSRCNSPNETSAKIATGSSTSTGDEKPTKSASEERAQQRVLRSSHRSGGQNTDRSSNNSSPQMQSTSPSPAPAVSADSNENNTSKGGNNASSSTSSPSVKASDLLEIEATGNAPSPSASSTSSNKDGSNTELHPRKRKIRTKQDDSVNQVKPGPSTSQVNIEVNSSSSEVHPHDHPFINCYQMYINVRKQIEERHKSLIPIHPRPPQGFKGYLLNRRTYVLASTTPSEPLITLPKNLPNQMKDLYISQEKERFKLKMQHIVEKEKLGLMVEQEILRVHGKAARSLACQSLPFSACTVLRDEEVYNMITPEQEEQDRNARSRYNGRLFLSWLQDVDDKWEKIKESMVLRHHNEAESLHAVQKMDWEWVMKENALCDFKSQPEIDEHHVPIVHVSDDFDLLPA